MEEEWKDIEGFEGLYRVSNKGRIFSVRNNKILKQSKNNTYYKITLRYPKNRKIFCFRIHRLVAKHFIPNPKNKKTVNHIDGDKNNNRIDNLEWATTKENNTHAILNGLSKPATPSYRFYGIDENGKRILYMSGKEIINKGYDLSHINNVINGKSKRHKGLTFEKVIFLNDKLLNRNIVNEILTKKSVISNKINFDTKKRIEKILKQEGLDTIEKYDAYVAEYKRIEKEIDELNQNAVSRN